VPCPTPRLLDSKKLGVSLAAAPEGPRNPHAPASSRVRRLGTGPSGVPSPAPVHPGALDRPSGAPPVPHASHPPPCQQFSLLCSFWTCPAIVPKSLSCGIRGEKEPPFGYWSSSLLCASRASTMSTLVCSKTRRPRTAIHLSRSLRSCCAITKIRMRSSVSNSASSGL